MAAARESLVTVDFRDLGARTEVVLRADNFAGVGPIEIYGAGRAGGIETLRAQLRGEP